MTDAAVKLLFLAARASERLIDQLAWALGWPSVEEVLDGCEVGAPTRGHGAAPPGDPDMTWASKRGLVAPLRVHRLSARPKDWVLYEVTPLGREVARLRLAAAQAARPTNIPGYDD